LAFRPEWYRDEPRRGFGGGVAGWSGIKLLLILNFGVFALQVMSRSAMTAPGIDPIAGLFGLRAWTLGGAGELGFNLLFPFQLVTYMFVHGDLWHVGFNMLFMWMFGRELEASMGKTGFLRLFFTGGIVGGLAQWGLNLAQADVAPVIGASGAVYSVMALYALRYPRRQIIMFLPFPLPVPVIFLVGFKVAGDIIGLLNHDPRIAVLAHLGGAAIGLVWHLRGDVIGKAKMSINRKQAEKRTAAESGDRREMDRILRKIQSDGLPSLTTDERAFLDRRSKALRERRD